MNVDWAKIIMGVAIALGATAATLAAAKLAGFIAWHWWVILSPVWVPAAIVAVIVVVLLVFLAKDEEEGGNPFQ